MQNGVLHVSKSNKTLLVRVRDHGKEKELQVDVNHLPEPLARIWSEPSRRKELSGVKVLVEQGNPPVRVFGSGHRGPSTTQVPPVAQTAPHADAVPLPFLESKADVALVVLASEQLWPNLESVCLYELVLRRLFVLHTEDEQKSLQPAQAIENIVRAQFGIEATRVLVGMEPRKVSEAVRSILAECPGYKVVLNATGGTKLMTAGMLRWVGEDDTATIYREFHGTWFALRRAEDNRQIVAVPLQTPDHPTDLLAVEVLVQEVWGQGGYDIVIGSGLPELPVEEISKRACQYAGRPNVWPEAFGRGMVEVTGRAGSGQSGFLFEQFVAGCVRHLGVTNGVMNVERRDGTAVLQELDIIVNAGGRVCVIDCKLPQAGETAAVMQCSTAAHIRRQLGGLSGGYMLVRPNWRPSQWMRELCKRLGLELIDCQDFGQLCDRLARFMRIKADTEKVKAVDNWLAQYNQQRPLPGTMSPSPKHALLAQQTVRNVAVPSDAWLSELAHTGNRNWAALQLREWAMVVVFPPRRHREGQKSPSEVVRVRPDVICRFVLERLQKAGYDAKILDAKASKQKSSVTLVLSGITKDALTVLPDTIPVT